jgi:predicted patatin/cPLA2 family phospholipase
MTGLVLEGGGMRGLFTAGVLDAFLDRGIGFDRIYGVSAGACNMISYITGQRGRSRAVNVDFVNDKRYMSWDNLLRTGSLFGEEMMFHTIPNDYLPFDYDRYQELQPDAWAVCTSLLSGRAVYLRVPYDLRNEYQPILASMSLPLISKPVPYHGDLLLDGGIADPIPVKRALTDGCERPVIVLTRELGYQKQPESTLKLSRAVYHRYPTFVRTIQKRHIVYNDTLSYIRQLEEEGRAVVIRPPHPVGISRTEKDTGKLDALYREGYAEGMKAVID